MRKVIPFLLALLLVAGFVSCKQHPRPSSKKSKPKTETAEFVLAKELAAQDSSAARTLYLVSRVIDGDTIEITDGIGKMKLRLIGVDTPETVHPQKPVQYFGKEASNFVKLILENQEVYLELDPINTRLDHLDRYNRLLAYVYRASDSLFVNAAIIRMGYGHAYIKYEFRYMDWFEQLQREAREESVGLWKEDSGK